MTVIPTTSADAVDLRRASIDDVLSHVATAMNVRWREETITRKRRSIGAQTDRGTWVRIERRTLSRITAQGWNGTESASHLTGIAQPAWLGCLVWRGSDEAVMWRADETELLPGTPVGTAVLGADPGLPNTWWQSLNATLDALADQHTTRIATPDMCDATQELVTRTVHEVFPASLNTVVSDWVPAHADLNWANVAAPTFSLFDWEDWGNAPRGLDSASLWASSLAVPALADRVWKERRTDFESRDGKLMVLFACAKVLGPHAHPQDPRLDLARHTAQRVIGELQGPPVEGDARSAR